MNPLTAALRRLSGIAALLTSTGLVASEVLVQTDFGGELLPIETEKPEMISGQLPASVAEDSSWAKVRVHYSPIADRLGSDLKWVRAEVSEIERGQPQLKWMLGTIHDASQFRLQATLGSSTGSRLGMRIMDAGPPYTAHWEETIVPNVRRESYRFEFELPATSQPVALVLSMDQTGSYDFYSLELTRRSEAEVETARLAAIEAAPTNLAPNGGFALGLPAAWGIGRKTSLSEDASFHPAAKAGPYGTVPLKIEVLREGARYDLYSAPFSVPDNDSLYVVSFLASGDGEGDLTVYADGEVVGSGPFQASPEGKRVKIPFKIRGQSEWIVLHWSGHDSLELDALNVSLGRKALPFQLPGEVEVALAAGFEKNNVFVDGVEPVAIEYAVTGEMEGLTLRTQTFDFYGEASEPRSLPAPEKGALASFTPELPDPQRVFGSFRVEAWAERKGERVSPIAEQVYHVVERPIYWGEIAQESKLGNHFSHYEPHFYSAKAIGINWNRFHGGNAEDTTYWSAVEPRKGEWTWRDDNILPFREADFALCAVWARVPYWARIERDRPEAQGWLDNWWQPRSLDEFAEYVRRSAEHHDGVIDAWQIWNEPWGEFWFKEWDPSLQGEHRWHPGETPVEDFAELSQTAWDTIQENNIDTTVLGVGATMGERGKKWMRDALAADIEYYSDAISYHAYFGGKLQLGLQPDSALLRNLEGRVFHPIQQKEGADAMPIWMTEGNWLEREIDSGMHENSVPGRSDPLAVVRETAVKIPLYHAIQFAHGADKIFTYSMGAGPSYYRPANPGQINWASLVTPSGELHPTGTVYAAMARRMDPARAVDQVNLGGMRTAYIFANERNEGGFIALFGEDLTTSLETLQAAGYVVDDFLGNPAKPGITHQLLYINLDDVEQADACLSLLTGSANDG